MAGVAAAFALAAVLLLDPNIEENDGRDGDAQPASSGPKTRAAITPRRGSRDQHLSKGRNSVTPTPPIPQRLGPKWLTSGKSAQFL
jgi:hypothetical protein